MSDFPRREYASLADLDNIGVPVAGSKDEDRSLDATRRATSWLKTRLERDFLPHRGRITFSGQRARQMRLELDVKTQIAGLAIAPRFRHRATVWDEWAAVTIEHRWLPLDLKAGEVSNWGLLLRNPPGGSIEVDCLQGAFVEEGGPVDIGSLAGDVLTIPARALYEGNALVLLTREPSTLEDLEICEVATVNSGTEVVLHRALVGTSKLANPHQYVRVAPHPTVHGAAKQLANKFSALGGRPVADGDSYIVETSMPEVWREIMNMRSGRQLARLGVPSPTLSDTGAY